jgi:hypothetical protein
LEQDIESPALLFKPAAEPPAPVPEASDPSAVSISDDQNGFSWPADTGIQIIRATCAWIQYGTVGFAAVCILIGALEGILGR